MTEATNELMYEVLKTIQSDLTYVKDAVKELKLGQTMIRRDVHEVKGDIMRLDEGQARLDIRLERIEKRLDLVDA